MTPARTHASRTTRCHGRALPGAAPRLPAATPAGRRPCRDGLLRRGVCRPLRPLRPLLLLLLGAWAAALDIPAGPTAPLHAAAEHRLEAWWSQQVEAPLRAALPAAGQASTGAIITLLADPTARPSPALLTLVRTLRANRMDVPPIPGIAYALVEDRVIGPSGWTMVLLRSGAKALAQDHRLPALRLVAEMAAMAIARSWNDAASLRELREQSLTSLEELLSAPADADPGAEQALWTLWQRAAPSPYEALSSIERVVASSRKVHGDGTWLGAMLDGALAQLQLNANRRSPQALSTAQAVLTAFTRAQTLHPDRPEAALEVLRQRSTQAMMGADDDGDDDNETWFVRAVTAELDAPEAYRLMAACVLSCPTCRNRFARACLATGRFDTVVPLAYLSVNGFTTQNTWMARRTGGHDWHTGRRRADLDRLLAGYAAGPLAGDPRLHLLEAELLLLAGEPARALALVKTVPADLDVKDGSLLVQLTRNGRPIALVREEAEARALAGDAFARIDAAVASGDQPAALAALVALLAAHPQADAVRRFALRVGAALQVSEPPQDIQDPSPLPYVAMQGQAQAVRWLLEQGEPVDAVDHEGRTALQRAAERNAADVIKQLIAHGAQVNATDAQGRTALHVVASLTQVPVGLPPAFLQQMMAPALQTLRLLLDNGAQANARDHAHRLPVQDALQRQWADGVNALVAAGGLEGLSAAERAQLLTQAKATPAGAAIIAKLTAGKGPSNF